MRKIDVLRYLLTGYGAYQLLRLMGCRDEQPVVISDITQVEPPPGTRVANASDFNGTARSEHSATSPSRTAEACPAFQRIILDTGVEIDPNSFSWQLFTPDTPPISGGNGDDYTTSFNLVGDPEAGVMVTFATYVTGEQPTLESYAFNDPGMALFEQVHTRPINILDPEVQAKLLASGIAPETIDESKNHVLRNPRGFIKATNHYGYRLFRQNCDGSVETAFIAPDVIGIQIELILPTPESIGPTKPEWQSLYSGVGVDFTS